MAGYPGGACRQQGTSSFAGWPGEPIQSPTWESGIQTLRRWQIIVNGMRLARDFLPDSP